MKTTTKYTIFIFGVLNLCRNIKRCELTLLRIRHILTYFNSLWVLNKIQIFTYECKQTIQIYPIIYFGRNSSHAV